MADTKISDLPAVTDVIATDEYVLARAGVTDKITAANLLVADAVSFTPAGSIAATDVQAAIEEVATEASTGAIALLGNIALNSVQAFTSIPGTYNSLKIVLLGRGSATGFLDIAVRFNSDSGSNYDYKLLNSFNGSVSDQTSTSQTSGKVAIVPGSDSTAGRGGIAEIIIPMYAGTTFHKECFSNGSMNGGSSASTAAIQIRSMTWKSTAAITQIDFILPSGSWASGSRAQLYGIL